MKKKDQDTSLFNTNIAPNKDFELEKIKSRKVTNSTDQKIGKMRFVL